MRFRERMKSAAPKLYDAVDKIIKDDGVWASEHKSISYAFAQLELGDFNLTMALDEANGTIEDFFKSKELEYLSDGVGA